MLAYVGDLSHPQLQVLDNLKRKGLTYNGWEADEDIKVFLTCREIIRKKQNNIHMGDRSHPQLQALDNMKRTGLTYNGWQADVLKAEDFHVRYPRRYVR